MTPYWKLFPIRESVNFVILDDGVQKFLTFVQRVQKKDKQSL